MKQDMRQMNDEDLAEFRRVDAEYKAMDSGSVSLKFEDAAQIVERYRAFWTRMYEAYDLDIEEFYIMDPITGTISVDKAE